MHSSNHNLNNPTSKISLDLLREVSSLKCPTVQPTKQVLYDLLETKDPHTIYVITDAPKLKMYYGDKLIHNDDQRPQYLIGQGRHPNEYVLYYSIPNWNDHIVEICRFDDPQKALNTMAIYNHAGSHSTVDLEVYTMLKAYIDDEISINDLIIGCLVAFGYKDDPRTQDIIQKCNSFGVADRDLPPMFRRELRGFRDNSSNALFKQYSAIYDIIVKYDFLKGPEYQSESDIPDLADVIKDIGKCICENLMGEIHNRYNRAVPTVK